VSRAHRIGILLSAIGIGISAFILGEKIGFFPEVCGPAWGPFGGCKTVEASQWSSIGPIPIAAIGLVGSLFLLITAYVHARTKREEALMLWLFAGIVGSAIEIALIFIQALFIGEWCGKCLLYGATVLISAAAAISASLAYARSTRA
jgi:uncharacterized membrane protein